jgi:hypothetical protein
VMPVDWSGRESVLLAVACHLWDTVLWSVSLLLQHGSHILEDQPTKDKSYKSREELSSITINVECLIVSAVDTT